MQKAELESAWEVMGTSLTVEPTECLGPIGSELS